MNVQDKMMKEKQKHDYVLNFLRKKNLIESEENIIFLPKAFVVRSALRWCLDEIQNKQMTPAQWDKYQKIISQYIAGIIDLKWDEGVLKIHEIKNERKRRRLKKNK